MRVSAFSNDEIPVLNQERAVRFYREVFDLPATFTAHEQSHLSFLGKLIHFPLKDATTFNPIALKVKVNDTPEDITNHLINYEVPQTQPVEQRDGQTIFHIADFEGNQIQLITNKNTKS
ncbi:putative enzyme related to lactoylglutathione lyase [Weissella uvarum]|uniref:VOC family protein n=1 Tax=Weissella uvarum TaxID=1479233 RepID=UPI0019614A11|nr:lactoylglutathione lyase [Weissella uvarum]MBM7617816.1 putative enzyme related to lactoylglutathione lyase [Weissella uvarum]MCM0595805.1 lactoylglutathione lyase [Weissella uvarum]